MELFPFFAYAYTYAYVTPVRTYLSYFSYFSYAYVCACAYVCLCQSVNQPITMLHYSVRDFFPYVLLLLGGKNTVRYNGEDFFIKRFVKWSSDC